MCMGLVGQEPEDGVGVPEPEPPPPYRPAAGPGALSCRWRNTCKGCGHWVSWRIKDVVINQAVAVPPQPCPPHNETPAARDKLWLNQGENDLLWKQNVQVISTNKVPNSSFKSWCLECRLGFLCCWDEFVKCLHMSHYVGERFKRYILHVIKI